MRWLPVAASLLALALPGQGAIQFRRADFVASDGTRVRAETGSLEVPERHGAATKVGTSIELAFVRVRSPVAAPGAPLFVLAGGPGGSSIRKVVGLVTSGGARMLEACGGDIVGIDQRGVGRSRPVLQTLRVIPLPLDEPGDPARYLELARPVVAELAAHWQSRGVDLSAYDTRESAHDIDAVRRALGYDEIVLWGGSYGSHLACAYLRAYGGHVARAVLIGPEGPDHTIKLPSYADTGLERIDALLARDPALRARIPDLTRMVREVLARLEAKPVTVAVGSTFGRDTEVTIGKWDAQRALAQAIGRTSTMLPVPAAVHAMSRGDFTWLAKETLRFRRNFGMHSAMAAAMDCASGLSVERAATIARERRTSVLGDAVNFPFPGIAAAWGVADLGPEFRAPLHSDVPVLFLCGDLDSRTPVRNGRELAARMPNARVVVCENAGHDVDLGHPPLRAVLERFLAGGEVDVDRVVMPPPRFEPID